MTSTESEQRNSDLPSAASVVVIGAGLAGLVAARELVAAGVEDVVVVDGRDRIGGRLADWPRPDGTMLMKGGEFTSPSQPQLLALAAELGIAAEPLPPFADPENMGAFVRMHDGRRHVEAMPLADDPEAAQALGEAIAQLDALAQTIPVEAPWDAPGATELDRQSIGQWIDANVANDAAREDLLIALGGLGDAHEVSLLYVATFLAGFGGWEPAFTFPLRFVGGTAQIPRRIADALGGRTHVSCAVRLIERTAEGVAVHTDRGTISARAAILAMQPGQCSKIEFGPVLPSIRDRLQSRWLAGHGAKVFAIYDRPFWRDAGLSGIAMGLPELALVLDTSPSDGSEGILCAMQFASSVTLARHEELLADPDRSRQLIVDALVSYFGPQAAEFKELHDCRWDGDRWSDGCGSGLPLGVLSTVGRALRKPVGPLVWAGAETGLIDFMEGAVTSGQRAAREAASLVAAAGSHRSQEAVAW
jgi:monoamine oxidase